MSFDELVSRDRRLVILRFLAEDQDRTLNTSILQDALDQVGHVHRFYRGQDFGEHRPL